MKTMLVPLIGQHDLENPLEVERSALVAGFDLARRFEAHVRIVSLIDRPPVSPKKWPVWWPSGGAVEILDWIDQISEQRRKNAIAQYNTLLRDQDPQPLQTDSPTPGFTSSFTEEVGEIVEMLGPICRLSDLVIISTADTNWIAPFSPLVAEILRDAGKPMLCSPSATMRQIG
tara:strand:+ start:184 stop:702 length:519 start_codon:yes stop_codon:yes gene_type:complete